jgi:hypothetical protein
MSINLPTANSQVRQLIDVAVVAEMLSPENRAKLPTLRQALSSAVEMFSADKAISSVCIVCRRADGSIVLERIGNRGGHNTVWTFIEAQS